METTILVIEDHPDLRKLFKHLLQGNGYTLILACDWREAQAIFADGCQPDLVIFDWLVTNTAGCMWADYLRTNLATTHIPIMFICDETPPREVSDLLSTIGIPIIQKPFDIFVFRRRVSTLLTPRERMAGAQTT